jgi:hypothetical protein
LPFFQRGFLSNVEPLPLLEKVEAALVDISNDYYARHPEDRLQRNEVGVFRFEIVPQRINAALPPEA